MTNDKLNLITTPTATATVQNETDFLKIYKEIENQFENYLNTPREERENSIYKCISLNDELLDALIKNENKLQYFLNSHSSGINSYLLDGIKDFKNKKEEEAERIRKEEEAKEREDEARERNTLNLGCNERFYIYVENGSEEEEILKEISEKIFKEIDFFRVLQFAKNIFINEMLLDTDNKIKINAPSLNKNYHIDIRSVKKYEEIINKNEAQVFIHICITKGIQFKDLGTVALKYIIAKYKNNKLDLTEKTDFEIEFKD